MKALLDYVSTVTDSRQEKKVLHKMMDIIMLVFFIVVERNYRLRAWLSRKFFF